MSVNCSVQAPLRIHARSQASSHSTNPLQNDGGDSSGHSLIIVTSQEQLQLTRPSIPRWQQGTACGTSDKINTGFVRLLVTCADLCVVALRSSATYYSHVHSSSALPLQGTSPLTVHRPTWKEIIPPGGNASGNAHYNALSKQLTRTAKSKQRKRMN